MTKLKIEIENITFECTFPATANVWVQWSESTDLPINKEWNKVNLGSIHVPTPMDIKNTLLLMIECYELEDLVNENKLHFFIASGDPEKEMSNPDLKITRYDFRSAE